MKNIKLLLMVVIGFVPAWLGAKQISREVARQVAETQVRSHTQLRSDQTPELNLVYVETTATANKTGGGQAKVSGNASGDVLYYVFNAGDNGFVIVSGDDIAVPVLGYSDSGTYDPDNLASNFVYWMDCLGNEIKEAITNGFPQSEKTKEQWDTYLKENTSTLLRASNSVVVNPILTTKWNQTSPYNDLCPNQAVTGCVATAMAQIMKKHNYPTPRTVTIPAYTTRTNNWSISALPGATYVWTSMADTYNSSSSSPEKTAVATLMRDCGAAVEMDYTLSSSGAFSEDVALALVTYFNYDQSIQLKKRDYYTNAQWDLLLQTELGAGRPVYYSGSSASGGGHAFVCDGYDNNEIYHFNWGWGGYQDGWFVTTALNPGGGGTGAGAGTYNQSQQIIVNIKPNAGGAKSNEIKIWSQTDISASKTILDPGESFSVNITIGNLGFSIFTGSVGIAIVDASDNILSVIAQKSSIIWNPNNGNNFSINSTIPAATPPGSCRIRVVYKSDDDSQWGIATGTPGYIDVLNLTITNNPPQTHGIKILSNSILAGSDLTSSASIVNRGEIFTVSAGYINRGTTTITGDYGIALVDNSDLILEIIGVSRTNASLDPNSYWTSPTVTNCGISSAVSPGNYKIRAVFRPTGEDWSIIPGETSSVIDIVNITVNNTIVPDNSNVFMNSAFTVSPNPVDQFSPLSVQVSVGNLSTTSTFFGELELGLYDTPGNSQTLLEVIEKIQPVFLSTYSAGSFTFNSSSVNLPGGTYYMSLYQKSADGVRKKVINNGKNNDLLITVIGIPPTVSTTSPANGANNVPIEGQLIITFDKSMNTTPSVGVVTLGGGIVSNEYKTWSSNDRVCTIPYSDLAYNTSYTYNISGFKDASGNVMDAVTSVYSFTTIASPASTTWNPQSSSTAWAENANWTNGVPSTTTKVIIPKSSSYPILTTSTAVAEIHFEPGAELGRQDLLTYDKAYVQLDFSNPTSRNRWWMLTNPLQQLYSGDFSFGGLPGMDIKAFSTATSGEGAWQSLLPTRYEHEFGSGDSFEIWLASDDPTESKGLKASNGIITLPYFEDPGEKAVHWAQDYDPATQKSTFFAGANGGSGFERTTSSSPVIRDLNKAYKLVALTSGGTLVKNLDFGKGTGSSSYFYAATGNPFMSSISFSQLQNNNSSLISKSYWVWVGAGANNATNPGSYAVYNSETNTTLGNTSASLSNVIPPMQSFIVERQGTTGTTITFDIASINATGQNGTGLRMAAQPGNVLEIIASTPQSAVRAVVASRENGSLALNPLDSRKLFTEINSLPDVYTLKPGINNGIVAVAANILNEIKEDIVIPLGISTTYEGSITLSFAGMDTYNARIFLTDANSSDKAGTELTGKTNYEYTFNYKPGEVNGTAVSNENRFFIRLSPMSPTGTVSVTPNGTLVYSPSASTIQAVSNELMQQVSVFNALGQKIYDNASVNAYEHTIAGLAAGIYVVKVVVNKNEVKTTKIIVK